MLLLPLDSYLFSALASLSAESSLTTCRLHLSPAGNSPSGALGEGLEVGVEGVLRERGLSPPVQQLPVSERRKEK